MHIDKFCFCVTGIYTRAIEGRYSTLVWGWANIIYSINSYEISSGTRYKRIYPLFNDYGVYGYFLTYARHFSQLTRIIVNKSAIPPLSLQVLTT